MRIEVIYFINLDKIKEENYNVGISDRVKKYFRLFNAKSIKEMKKISKGDDVLMSITECLKEFLNNEETRKDFAREEWEARKNQAIGEERSLNTVAKNLLKMKADIKYITDATGLTEQEVLKLQKTLQ